jgi:hypothetical protein
MPVHMLYLKNYWLGFIEFWYWSLNWKLYSKYNFGFYLLDINPNLHEAQIEWCWDIQKWHFVEKNIHNIKYRDMQGISEVPLWQYQHIMAYMSELLLDVALRLTAHSRLAT